MALQGPSLKSFPIVVCRSTAGVAGKKSALQIADFRQHRGAQAARQGQTARVSFFRFLSWISKKGTSKSKLLAEPITSDLAQRTRFYMYNKTSLFAENNFFCKGYCLPPVPVLLMLKASPFRFNGQARLAGRNQLYT